MRSEGYNATDTSRVILRWATTNEMRRVEEKDSTRDTDLEGVCIIESFAFRKKSAEPPKPFSMREPRAFVELA